MTNFCLTETKAAVSFPNSLGTNNFFWELVVKKNSKTLKYDKNEEKVSISLTYFIQKSKIMR
jgi:hypothetical protein